MKAVILTLAAAMVVTPVSFVAAQTNQAGQSAAAQTDPAQFAQMAASSNMFEVESSRLALEKAQDQKVRDFAQKMIDDHTRAGERMMQVAQEAGMQPPTTMMPEDKQQLDRLSQVQDFDRAYMQAQVAAHEKAVALFQGFAQNGQEGPLRNFAQETLPTLEQHLASVRQLAGM